ncbi:hypothetical protein RQP46_004195 [Phenoliferia psychrophenolica]
MGDRGIKERVRSWFQLKYWWRWLLVILITVAVILLSVFRDKIVDAIEPHKAAILNFPASWVFPILILVVLSFPPLFGHEVVHIIIGLIWGFWKGFLITSAGVFFGELACFFVFRYFLTARAVRMQNKSTPYACLAKLLAEGHLGILTLVRYSVIPGHVVTAIESTVGAKLWVYSLAMHAPLSLKV